MKRAVSLGRHRASRTRRLVHPAVEIELVARCFLVPHSLSRHKLQTRKCVGSCLVALCMLALGQYARVKEHIKREATKKQDAGGLLTEKRQRKLVATVWCVARGTMGLVRASAHLFNASHFS